MVSREWQQGAAGRCLSCAAGYHTGVPAERAPHGWHKCPWRGMGQQKCPCAWRRDIHVTVRLPLTSPA